MEAGEFGVEASSPSPDSWNQGRSKGVSELSGNPLRKFRLRKNFTKTELSSLTSSYKVTK